MNERIESLLNGDIDPVSDARLLRRRGRTFQMASHLLGPRHRSRATRLYGFCRAIDDLADDSDNLRRSRERLDRVSEDIAPGTGSTTLGRKFLDLARDTGMPASPALHLIAGIRSDLEQRVIHSERELVRYAYQVAGTVGLMMCSVLDVTNRQALPFAIGLGIAMQLSNIARDVGEDAGMGRRHLPGGWVDNMPAPAIANPDTRCQETLRHATVKCLFLTDRYYCSGLSGLRYLPVPARQAILVAACVYREIGNEIAPQGHRSWNQRAIVPGWRRIRVAAGALCGRRYVPYDRVDDLEHDTTLQRHIADLSGAS